MPRRSTRSSTRAPIRRAHSPSRRSSPPFPRCGSSAYPSSPCPLPSLFLRSLPPYHLSFSLSTPVTYPLLVFRFLLFTNNLLFSLLLFFLLFFSFFFLSL